MARKLYTGPLVNVSFDLDVCQHAAECVRGMPSVFDTSKRPWIDPETYDVAGYGSLPAEVPFGTDYVVASEASFGPYLADREHYPAEAANYERLFASLRLLAEFPQQEGNGVRIYAVP